MLLITRNWAGAEDDDVGRFDFDELVGAGSHAVEDGVELALRTSTDDGDFAVGEFDDVFHFHDRVLRDFNRARAKGGF